MPIAEKIRAPDFLYNIFSPPRSEGGRIDLRRFYRPDLAEAYRAPLPTRENGVRNQELEYKPHLRFIKGERLLGKGEDVYLTRQGMEKIRDKDSTYIDINNDNFTRYLGITTERVSKHGKNPWKYDENFKITFSETEGKTRIAVRNYLFETHEQKPDKEHADDPVIIRIREINDAYHKASGSRRLKIEFINLIVGHAVSPNIPPFELYTAIVILPEGITREDIASIYGEAEKIQFGKEVMLKIPIPTDDNKCPTYGLAIKLFENFKEQKITNPKINQKHVEETLFWLSKLDKKGNVHPGQFFYERLDPETGHMIARDWRDEEVAVGGMYDNEKDRNHWKQYGEGRAKKLQTGEYLTYEPPGGGLSAGTSKSKPDQKNFVNYIYRGPDGKFYMFTSENQMRQYVQEHFPNLLPRLMAEPNNLPQNVPPLIPTRFRPNLNLEPLPFPLRPNNFLGARMGEPEPVVEISQILFRQPEMPRPQYEIENYIFIFPLSNTSFMDENKPHEPRHYHDIYYDSDLADGHVDQLAALAVKEDRGEKERIDKKGAIKGEIILVDFAAGKVLKREVRTTPRSIFDQPPNLPKPGGGGERADHHSAETQYIASLQKQNGSIKAVRQQEDRQQNQQKDQQEDASLSDSHEKNDPKAETLGLNSYQKETDIVRANISLPLQRNEGVKTKTQSHPAVETQCTASLQNDENRQTNTFERADLQGNAERRDAPWRVSTSESSRFGQTTPDLSRTISQQITLDFSIWQPAIGEIVDLTSHQLTAIQRVLKDLQMSSNLLQMSFAKAAPSTESQFIFPSTEVKEYLQQTMGVINSPQVYSLIGFIFIVFLNLLSGNIIIT